MSDIPSNLVLSRLRDARQLAISKRHGCMLDWEFSKEVVDELERLIQDRDERERLRVMIAERELDVRQERDRLRATIEEADGCFEAALVEGWIDALENGDIERLRDLWYRRIAMGRISLSSVEHRQVETEAQPGDDIADLLERRGDALSLRAARHIRIKWNTEAGLDQQLRHANERLNAQQLPVETTPNQGPAYFQMPQHIIDKAVEVRCWFDERGFTNWNCAGIGPMRLLRPNCGACGGTGTVLDTETAQGGPCPACSPEWRGNHG